MNKFRKIRMISFVLLLMICCSGCSLAIADADVATDSKDKLIGAVITTEYLDIGKTYATVDKKNSPEPLNWEIYFKGIEGIHFFDATFQYEDDEPFTMQCASDEICDMKSHINTSDTDYSTDISGSLYLPVQEEGTEYLFYFNPVYQESNGKIYVTSGSATSYRDYTGSSDSLVGSLSLDNTITITENGQAKTESSTVKVDIYFVYEPTNITLYFMNAEHEILKQDSFEPGKVPEEMKVVSETAYMIAETTLENGEIKRELFNLSREEELYIETYYKVSNMGLGKKNTQILFE